MIEAVFISDLHLHPDEDAVTKRFDQFIHWAIHHVKSVYILGDFFHVWPGDDAMDTWEVSIAKKLATLSDHGIKVYFMAGNRDFLLGDRFINLAKMKQLPDPTSIRLDGLEVLLSHGDRYCTKDKSHQWLRFATRNRLFKRVFLWLPLKFRDKLVQRVRQYSQENQRKLAVVMDVVDGAVLRHLKTWQLRILIHGHTHRPAHHVYQSNGLEYNRYVLSDWEDKPSVLCYDQPGGIYFSSFGGKNGRTTSRKF